MQSGDQKKKIWIRSVQPFRARGNLGFIKVFEDPINKIRSQISQVKTFLKIPNRTDIIPKAFRQTLIRRNRQNEEEASRTELIGNGERFYWSRVIDH